METGSMSITLIHRMSTGRLTSSEVELMETAPVALACRSGKRRLTSSEVELMETDRLGCPHAACTAGRLTSSEVELMETV